MIKLEALNLREHVDPAKYPKRLFFARDFPHLRADLETRRVYITEREWVPFELVAIAKDAAADGGAPEAKPVSAKPKCRHCGVECSSGAGLAAHERSHATGGG